MEEELRTERGDLNFLLTLAESCQCLRQSGNHQVSTPTAGAFLIASPTINRLSIDNTMDPDHDAKFPLHEAAREGKSMYLHLPCY